MKEYKLTIDEFEYRGALYEMDLTLDIHFEYEAGVYHKLPEDCYPESLECEINDICFDRLQVYNEDLDEVDICGASDDFIGRVTDYVNENRMDEIIEFGRAFK